MKKGKAKVFIIQTFISYRNNGYIDKSVDKDKV